MLYAGTVLNLIPLIVYSLFGSATKMFSVANPIFCVFEYKSLGATIIFIDIVRIDIYDFSLIELYTAMV